MATQPNSPANRRWGLSDTGAQVFSALLLGLLIGLLIGWVIWPVEWVDADLENLRPDARAHFVAATADAYVASGGQDPGTALARMQSFSDPQNAVYEAIAYFQQSSDPNRAIREVNLRSLASALDRATTTQTAPSPQSQTDDLGWANWVLGILTGVLLVGGGLWIARRLLLNRRPPASALPAAGASPPPPPAGAAPIQPPPRPSGPVWVPAGPSDTGTAELRGGGQSVSSPPPGDEIRRIRPQSGEVIFETDGRSVGGVAPDLPRPPRPRAGLITDDPDADEFDGQVLPVQDLDEALDVDLDDDGFMDFSVVVPQSSQASRPAAVAYPLDRGDDSGRAMVEEDADWDEDGGWENDLDAEGDLTELDDDDFAEDDFADDDFAEDDFADDEPDRAGALIERIRPPTAPAPPVQPSPARQPLTTTGTSQADLDDEALEDFDDDEDDDFNDFDNLDDLDNLNDSHEVNDPAPFAARIVGAGPAQAARDPGEADDAEADAHIWQEREIDAAVEPEAAAKKGDSRLALPAPIPPAREEDEDEGGGFLPTVQGVLNNLGWGEKQSKAPLRSGKEISLFTAEFNAGIEAYAQSFTLRADGKEEGAVLGACGVGISESLDKGAANANQVHLLDVWLYDGVDVRTYNQYLVSPGLDTDELAGKAKSSGTITGEPLELRSGLTFRLATRNLILDCRIVAADFLQRESRPAPLRSVRLELSAKAAR